MKVKGRPRFGQLDFSQINIVSEEIMKILEKYDLLEMEARYVLFITLERIKDIQHRETIERVLEIMSTHEIKFDDKGKPVSIKKKIRKD